MCAPHEIRKDFKKKKDVVLHSERIFEVDGVVLLKRNEYNPPWHIKCENIIYNEHGFVVLWIYVHV